MYVSLLNSSCSSINSRICGNNARAKLFKAESSHIFCLSGTILQQHKPNSKSSLYVIFKTVLSISLVPHILNDFVLIPVSLIAL